MIAPALFLKNAFVNLHGRIIATFDQLKINDDQFLLVIEESFIPAVGGVTDSAAAISLCSTR